MVGVASVSSVAEVVDGIGVGSVVQTGVGDGGSGNDGSSDERCRDRELVDGGGGLLGGKTSGSGVIESSLEGSLGSGDGRPACAEGAAGDGAGCGAGVAGAVSRGAVATRGGEG